MPDVWQLLQAAHWHVLHNVSRFTDALHEQHRRYGSTTLMPAPLAAVSLAPGQLRQAGMVSKEDVGRATWLLLHTIAAQYPEKPTRQQRRDVTNLVDILTRMYPCAECARHFKEVVRSLPPRVSSRAELQRWTCEAHNVVNRSLGKPSFNCDLAAQRWGALECQEEDACRLDGRMW